LTQGIAATTAVAVVAAIATSAWLTVLVLASYESGPSAVGGGQLVISSLPDEPRGTVERTLAGVARETGASLLLALSTDIPEGTDVLFVPLAGGFEEPASPGVHYAYAPRDVAGSVDFRWFYATDATGQQLDDLVRRLEERGFSADVVTETLRGHLLFHLTEPGNALLVVSVAVLVLRAFAADAARHRRASFVRATVGWSRSDDARAELRSFAVLLAVVVAVAVIVGVVAWGVAGGFRRPDLVVPLALTIVGATSLVLLLARASFFSRQPLPIGARVRLVPQHSRRQGVLLPGVHVVLTALVIAGMLSTAGALQATRRAVEAAVLLEPYAGWKVMRTGIAGALSDDFDLALADVTREQLDTGGAVLRDTGSVPGTLVVTSARSGDARLGAEADLWTRASPSVDDLAELSFLLTTDVHAPGAPLTPPADPALAFDVHVVADPARAAGAREAALLPDVAPFDAVVQVPLDRLTDDVLATATGNGQALFPSSDSVDAALASRGAAGFVLAWDRVEDTIAVVLAQCRRQALVTMSAALLAIALLLVSTVRAGLEHVRSGQHRRRVLASVGRSSWPQDRGPVTRRAALTAGAAAFVVPLAVLLGLAAPAGAVATAAVVTLAESGVFTATVALWRRRTGRTEGRHGLAL